jgi:hypothetical protein
MMKSRKITMAAAAAGTVAAVTGLTLAGLALTGAASASTGHAAAAHGYTFTTLDNDHDPTFNQLLGINNHGLISGYFGIGSNSHPNKGYLLEPPYRQHSYVNENFPHSFQTQVTGLNGVGNTVGFFANTAGANFGFYTTGRQFKFHKVDFPHASNSSPQMDQLLGINNHGEAVGFYQNVNMLFRGYEYNIHTHVFKRIAQPGVTVNKTTPSLTSTSINNKGDVAGFYTNKDGNTVGFIKSTDGAFRSLNYPGSSMTQIFGINDKDEVVGAYTVGDSSTPPSYGFTWTPKHGFTEVNDPHGLGSTLINGVNDSGDLVGFFTNAADNNFVQAFLAVPKR